MPPLCRWRTPSNGGRAARANRHPHPYRQRPGLSADRRPPTGRADQRRERRELALHARREPGKPVCRHDDIGFGWCWDFVFIPEGEDKTLGCFPDEERWDFWSLDAYKNLVTYLENKDKENTNK